MAKNKPEGGPSNILRFQPAVTRVGSGGCTKKTNTLSADPITQQSLRLFKTFFAIEDAALRASLLTMLENIAMGTRAGRKRGQR